MLPPPEIDVDGAEPQDGPIPTGDAEATDLKPSHRACRANTEGALDSCYYDAVCLSFKRAPIDCHSRSAPILLRTIAPAFLS